MNKKKYNRRFITILLVSFILFWASLAICGVGIYEDSEQYIAMHIHREPGYPCFLWIFRQIFGDNYLVIACIVQCALAAYACTDLTDYISERFCLKSYETVIIYLLTLMPYILTPLFSVTHLMISNSILSEALTIPLFVILMKYFHMMIVDMDTKSSVVAFVVSTLLSMIRGQMLVTLIMWLVILLIQCVFKKRYSGLIVGVICMACVVAARGKVIKEYNYYFSGKYVNNTYTNITMLTNILYSTDRAWGESIEDDDLRYVFDYIYDKMEEEENTYQYAGDSIIDRVIYLEEVHDNIKFYDIEAGIQEILVSRGMDEYLDQNVAMEEYCDALNSELLPGCFNRWLPTYIVLGIRGAIRSIAITNTIFSIYALLAFIIATVWMIITLIKDIQSEEAWLVFIALLSVGAVAFSTALVIMCLSRYMVYGFPLFYISAFLAFRKMIRDRKFNK